MTSLTLQSIVGNKYYLHLTFNMSVFCPQSVCIDCGPHNMQCLFRINLPLFVIETNYAHTAAAESFFCMHTNFVLRSVIRWQLSVSILAPPFQFGSRYVPLDVCGVGRELIASRVSAEEAVYEGGSCVLVIETALLCLFVCTNVRCCVIRCYPARGIGGGPKHTPSTSLSSSASLYIAFMIKVWHFRFLRWGMFVWLCMN